MNIKHPFYNRAHDLSGLFKQMCKFKKLSSFMRILEKQAILDELNYSRDDYVGDGFEFLIELIIESHKFSKTVGITDYCPILSDDNGVDGIGKNLDDDRCVIQIKYRSNNESFLTSNNDHLSNMFSAADSNYGISTVESELHTLDTLLEKQMISKSKYIKRKSQLSNNTKRHYVFTTAKGLHYYTDNEMFNNTVHCYGYDEIRKLIDDNKPFWDMCYNIAIKLDPKVK